jgi:hypothetical protein
MYLYRVKQYNQILKTWKKLDYQEKIREPGNTTISGENHSTRRKSENQGIPQYQVKTTVPGKNQRTREYNNIR